MANEKYALLDTDFISKMHLIRKDDHNKLIDKIMAMPGYCFYCHKQIQVEIMRHNIAGAPEWFQSKIESKSICMYDDEMILDELSGVYGEWAISAYAGMLKTACDAYKDGYFEEKFVLVSQMDCRSISREDFLKQLQDDCDTIGEGQNLGELKSYVLLQVLNLKFGEQIYVFCSDDKNARNGVISIGGARCIAIAAEEYGSKFYANGAAPSGVLEHPGTLKDPGRVRESWQSTFGGSSNANKVAVLEEGMKYTPISIAPNEAQFLETRKFQIDEIARIFRVPPHMVGDLDKSSFSNIEQQSLEFVKYTLDPWVSRWEQAMVRALLSAEEKKKYFFKFNVDGLLRGDYQGRMQGYATARQNGWMSANDIRELENLDRIPAELGGDLYLINGNMTKLEDAGIFAGSGKGKDTGEEVLELEKESGKSGKRTGSRGTDSVHERGNC